MCLVWSMLTFLCAFPFYLELFTQITHTYSPFSSLLPSLPPFPANGADPPPATTKKETAKAAKEEGKEESRRHPN